MRSSARNNGGLRTNIVRSPFLCLSLYVRLSILLRADRVRGALNEGLDLHDVLVFQLAGEIRHALIAERAFEDEVFQVGDGLGRDITKVLDVAALIDAGHTVAEDAVAHIKQRAGLYVGGIRLYTFEQPRHLVLGAVWWMQLTVDHDGEDR